MFWTLVLYLVLVGLVVVPLVGLFAPYRWHSLGRFRRAYGPWLVNFDPRLTRRALLRDVALCLGFWLTLLILMVIPNDPLVVWPMLVGVFVGIIIYYFMENGIEGDRS